MSRVLTTLVQIGIGIPALYMGRMVWHDFINEMKELFNA